MWWLNFLIILLLIMASLVCLLGIKILNLKEDIKFLKEENEEEEIEERENGK